MQTGVAESQICCHNTAIHARYGNLTRGIGVQCVICGSRVLGAQGFQLFSTVGVLSVLLFAGLAFSVSRSGFRVCSSVSGGLGVDHVGFRVSNSRCRFSSFRVLARVESQQIHVQLSVVWLRRKSLPLPAVRAVVVLTGLGVPGLGPGGCVFGFRAQVFGGSEFGRLKVQGSSVP